MSDALDPQRVLLLAIAITEWDGARVHMLALEQVGAVGDLRAFRRNLTQIRRELEQWMDQWPRVTSPTLSEDQIKGEALLYLSKHQDELNDLLGGGE